MSDNKKATIVALSFVVTILALIGGILFLKEYKFGQRFYYVDVNFPDVGTLTIGDPVLISGMKVGKVADMKLSFKSVKVKLGIDSKFKAPIDSRFFIRSLGIMGERMVVIELGSSDTPLDTKREYVGVYETGIGEAMGGIGLMLKKVDTMLVMIKNIADSTVGNKNFSNNFNNIVNNLNSMTNDLNSLIKANRDGINKSINVTNQTVSKLPKLMASIDGTVLKLNTILESVDSSTVGLKDITSDVKSISSQTKDIVTQINNGQGSIGKIVKDENFYNQLLVVMNRLDSLSKVLSGKGIKIRFF